MILNLRDRDLVLKDSPLMVWVILSLEVVVELAGRNYLLVRYPYYALPDRTNAIQEGHWYCPFVGFTTAVGTFPPQTLGELFDLTDRALSAIPAATRLEEAAHSMGLGSPVLEHRGTIIELKESPTHGSGGIRAFRIERYGCGPRTVQQLRHITDPECLKGHVFLPIEEIKSNTSPLFNEGEVRRSYLAKPLISNLQAILEDEVEVAMLRRNATPTLPEHWFRNERGFLVMVDIAGFGHACKYTRENLANMHESGDRIAERFRVHLAQIFQELALRAGFAQMQFTGDGFIAGLPDRLTSTQSSPKLIEKFLINYRIFISELDEMNARISRAGIHIGSRLTIHYGDFDYGRIGGPTSLKADLAGDALVDLVRSDAALSQLLSKTTPRSNHAVALTSAARQHPEIEAPVVAWLGVLDEIEALVKERVIQISVGFSIQH